MSGFTEFLTALKESPKLGAAITSIGLMFLFIGLTVVFSVLDGGFMIALAVIMTLGVIGMLIMFFITLFMLYEDVT